MRWRRFLFALLALVLAAMSAEVATRFIFPGLSRKAETMQFTNPHRDQPESFEREPILFWSLKPNNVFWEVNEAGYRGPLRPMNKPAGTLRVCCLGDSCTFGLGTPPLKYHETYTARLETMLNERLQRPVEVLNFGCPGYSSFQGRKQLETVAADYHPDIVTAYFGINDGFTAIGFSDAEQRPWEMPPGWVGELQTALRRSDFYLLLTNGLTWARRASGKQDILRVNVTEFRQNFEEMKRFGAAHGFRVIIIPAYYLTGWGTVEPSCLNDVEPQIPLGRYYSASGKRAEELFYAAPDRVHPTATGHEVIAQALADAIAQLLGNKTLGRVVQ